MHAEGRLISLVYFNFSELKGFLLIFHLSSETGILSQHVSQNIWRDKQVDCFTRSTEPSCCQEGSSPRGERVPDAVDAHRAHVLYAAGPAHRAPEAAVRDYQAQEDHRLGNAGASQTEGA